jgi:hypothetical protein
MDGRRRGKSALRAFFNRLIDYAAFKHPEYPATAAQGLVHDAAAGVYRPQTLLQDTSV